MLKCKECNFWNQTGEEQYRGYCGLYSVNCITEVTHGRTPTRFMDKDEAITISALRLKGSEKYNMESSPIFMSNEHRTKALENRRRNTPIYPDMSELTDESRRMLRRLRRRTREIA